MLVRIVRMYFEPNKTKAFLDVFKSAHKQIESFDGCFKVDLLHDHSNPNVFTTLSLWKDHQSLESYRNSELFKATWSKTKPLFIQKPVAQSYHIHTKGKTIEGV
ncbi:MAG: putative quinol monooxygenase [Cyclobacteriaceae bacterium]